MSLRLSRQRSVIWQYRSAPQRHHRAPIIYRGLTLHNLAQNTRVTAVQACRIVRLPTSDSSGSIRLLLIDAIG
ncbi:hypothetical protein IG631_19780 [Alternaria alternata]|nr:hypothetical protein IG631_19780 [Alternaria alternata]